MVGVFEAGFMVIKTGFEIGFGHTDVFFGFVGICGFDYCFIYYGIATTFTIQWADVLPAIAWKDCF